MTKKRMLQFILGCVVLLQVYSADSYADSSSPVDLIFQDLELIDNRTFVLKKKLEDVELKLLNAEQKLYQDSKTAEKLQMQLNESEGRLRFWRGTTLGLAISTALELGAIALILKTR